MEGFFVILMFLVGSVVPLPHQLHLNHFNRRLLNEVETGNNEPPKAMKVRHVMEMFNDSRTDDYFWLHDENTSDPNVPAYLQEENKYTDLVMSGTQYIQDQIYAEMAGTIKYDDTTLPRRRGDYYYYERTEMNYLQYCRRLAPNTGDQPSINDVMPTNLTSSPEHVILDVNKRALGHTNYGFGLIHVSPNHTLVAFTEDTEGDNNYTTYVIQAETGKPVGRSLVGTSYNVGWVGNEALLYLTVDADNRPEKAWLHKLGDAQSNDSCLYHEKDDKFSLFIWTSKSQKFGFIASESTDTSFILYFDIANPEYGFRPLTPRIDGIKMTVSHQGNHFFITRRSKELYNSELVACPVSNVSAFTTILPHRESVKITYVELFSNHLVVSEREDGLTKLIIFSLPLLGKHFEMLQIARDIEFMDPAYAIYQSDSDFFSNILRFTYSSLRTPDTVFDYDMNTGKSVIKRTAVGNFDSSYYSIERKWATAPDGSQIPMSIVYRRDLVKLDGSDPLLLFSYGTYGLSRDPTFKLSIVPLLNRGFVYVLANVRGGGELGDKWSEDGKLLKKKNSFTDFIACAENLIEMKYTTKEKLVIDSVGAGGLIIAAVANMRPDLVKVVIAEMPIVDLLTTLLDPTIPDIESEWEEWGDPRIKEFYFYIKSYSPLDNVLAQTYPAMLVTTTQIDSRLYSNAAKFVAKLRDLKTGENMLLLKSHLGNGTIAGSGRSEGLKRDAFINTFILKALDMAG